MPVVEEQVTICADPQRTWDYLADPANLQVWDSVIDTAEQVEDGAVEPGIHWRGVAKLLGRRIPWETEFVEYQAPSRRVQRTTDGPMSFVLIITLEPVDEGTLLNYRVESEAGLGGVFGRIADSFVARASARSLRASLQTLKGLIEGADEQAPGTDVARPGRYRDATAPQPVGPTLDRPRPHSHQEDPMEQNREQRARESIAAFNRADWAAFPEYCHAGMVYEETGTGERIEGLAAFIEKAKEWRAALPDCTGEITRMLVDGDVAALEVVWRGTHSGPLATAAGPIPASGAAVEVWATTWQRWDGDKIVHERHHLDVLSILAQIGALPAQASA